MDSDTVVRITRSFALSRAEVWRAWTEPAVLERWWWPTRFQTTYRVDLRDSGAYRFLTADMPGMGRLDLSGRYLRVQPEERLEYTWHWAGEEIDTRVTVDFRESNGETAIDLLHEGFVSAEERANHVVGWTDCLDRLAALDSRSCH